MFLSVPMLLPGGQSLPDSTAAFMLICTPGCLFGRSVLDKIAKTAEQGLAIMPVVTEVAVGFPTDVVLASVESVGHGLCLEHGKMAGTVAKVFKCQMSRCALPCGNGLHPQTARQCQVYHGSFRQGAPAAQAGRYPPCAISRSPTRKTANSMWVVQLCATCKFTHILEAAGLHVLLQAVHALVQGMLASVPV